MRFQNPARYSALPALCLVFVLAAGCNVDVSKKDGENSERVRVQTPLGSVRVETEDVSAKDVGLPVYPGATAAPRKDNDDKAQADVNISTPWFGLKVVALRFQTDDDVDKVASYYEKELEKHGTTRRCRGNVNWNKDGFTCKEKPGDDDINLVVGTEQRHRMVHVERKDGRTEFALVYVNTSGERDTI